MRRRIINLEKICSGCEACVNVCPVWCISMEENKEGFLFPKIDEDKCVGCGKCEKTCPALNLNPRPGEGKAYAAWAKDPDIRAAGSSGGVFPVIAKKILKDGGAVFGAAFAGNEKVCHICVEKEEDLRRIIGSKYVQSSVGEAYKRAKELLDNGRKVLFSGTPCQTAGLLRYLNKSYEGLYTVDIICHGVPSPLVWKRYKEYLEEKNKAEMASLPNMRSKANGWAGYAFSAEFKNEKRYIKDHRLDPYMKLFIKELDIRMSCYNCRQRSLRHEADITLGDFWGIKKVMPDLYSDKGVSLVIINNENGEKLIKECMSGLDCYAADIRSAARYNPSLFSPSRYNTERDMFFTDLEKKGFIFAAKKHAKSGRKEKLKKIAAKILR